MGGSRDEGAGSESTPSASFCEPRITAVRYSYELRDRELDAELEQHLHAGERVDLGELDQRRALLEPVDSASRHFPRLSVQERERPGRDGMMVVLRKQLAFFVQAKKTLKQSQRILYCIHSSAEWG